LLQGKTPPVKFTAYKFRFGTSRKALISGNISFNLNGKILHVL
jgi:hypothetical protein